MLIHLRLKSQQNTNVQYIVFYKVVSKFEIQQFVKFNKHKDETIGIRDLV